MACSRWVGWAARALWKTLLTLERRWSCGTCPEAVSSLSTRCLGHCPPRSSCRRRSPRLGRPSGGSRRGLLRPMTLRSGFSIAGAQARMVLTRLESRAGPSPTGACECCQTVGAASTRACLSGPGLQRSSPASGARCHRPWARGRSSIAAASPRAPKPRHAAGRGSWWAWAC